MFQFFIGNYEKVMDRHMRKKQQRRVATSTHSGFRLSTCKAYTIMGKFFNLSVPAFPNWKVCVITVPNFLGSLRIKGVAV